MEELVGNRQALAPGAGREPTVDEAGQEDCRELEALGLVDGQHRDHVGVRVDLGRRLVIARIDQRLQMTDQEDSPIVREEGRLATDDLEEPGHVLERLVAGSAGRRGQPGEQAGPLQEGVQHLAARSLVGDLAVGPQVANQATDDGSRLR